MTFYSLVLFAHVTAVLALFAAMTFEALSLFHLRRASTVSEARRWIEPIPGLPLVALGSLLATLFSGIYLTIRISAFGKAWPMVTIGALLVVAPLAGIGGQRMRAIRLGCATATEIHAELRRRLQDPVLKVSLGIRIAVILGIVLLMGAQPPLWESVSIVGASLVVGLLASLLSSRRSASIPASIGKFGD